MTKLGVSVLGIIGFVIIGYLGFKIVNKPSTPSSINSPEPTSHQIQLRESSPYVIYSDDQFENYKDKKRVLFFFANWCPTCRPVDTEIQKRIAEIPNDIVILRVNYNDSDTDNTEKELAKKYGITYQHTFVLLDENGNDTKKWNGNGLDQIITMTK